MQKTFQQCKTGHFLLPIDFNTKPTANMTKEEWGYDLPRDITLSDGTKCEGGLQSALPDTCRQDLATYCEDEGYVQCELFELACRERWTTDPICNPQWREYACFKTILVKPETLTKKWGQFIAVLCSVFGGNVT